MIPTRRTALIAAFAFAALGASAMGLRGGPGEPPLPTEPEPEPRVALQEPAPPFELQDLSGRTVRLADHQGKIVVLEWTNPKCPVIQRCYASELVRDTLGELEELGGVVYLAINSTGNIPRDEVVARSREFLAQHDLSGMTVLIDHDGTVGHRYDARRTPHMFVIDARGVLRYHGAYTDDPTGRRRDATNLVLAAVRQVKAQRTVAPEYVRPYGCSVKYAAK